MIYKPAFKLKLEKQTQAAMYAVVLQDWIIEEIENCQNWNIKEIENCQNKDSQNLQKKMCIKPPKKSNQKLLPQNHAKHIHL